MMKQGTAKGHIAAFVTIFIWGTTFVSTKLLLVDFLPVEILVIRFVIGYAALWIVYPKKRSDTTQKQELIFAAAGLCGITLYYLLENIALTDTLASNVGVIISVAPFFTAIFSHLFLHSKRPGTRFYLGFVIAMIGICLISFQGGASFAFHPVGDLLALVAAIVWAIYSILTKKIGDFCQNTIQATRRTFFYGLLFMIPAVIFSDVQWEFSKLANPAHLFNLLFLGIGASALCFVTWNYAVKWLGSVKTSVYIYAVPIITVATSVVVLGEQPNAATLFGVIFTLAGLLLTHAEQI